MACIQLCFEFDFVLTDREINRARVTVETTMP